MRGGNSTTRKTEWWIDWRPLMASLCMHFVFAVGVGLLLTPKINRPPESVSLARVTLHSPALAPSFLEEHEFASPEQSQKLHSHTSRTDYGPRSAELALPATTASKALTALRQSPAARISATESNSSAIETPSGRALLAGGEGNTLADERLMAKDLERYLASQPPSGPTTEISLFGGTMKGHSFVFVIDRSASTASKHFTACDEIERQCGHAIDGLASVNRFGVVLYNDQVSVGPGLRLATSDEKKSAKERMFRYSPSGGTRHVDGLRAAMLQRSNVICWFSDGGDPYLTPYQVEELARLAARSKTAVHAWRLGKRPEDPEKDFMRILSERTGGEFREGLPSAK
jgi:hypothetical protein